jgi:hypothetical protein
MLSFHSKWNENANAIKASDLLGQASFSYFNLWFTELDFILLNKLQLGSLLAIFGSVGVVG